MSVAAILAETGNLARFDSARAVVKHAGLCPRENSSGAYRGTTTISGRGRPLLRVAAWRAAFAALTHNEVYATRYRHLTNRETSTLKPNQARVAIAAALLRQLFVVITTATPVEPRHRRRPYPTRRKDRRLTLTPCDRDKLAAPWEQTRP